MKLYIDTSSREKVVIALDGKLYESLAKVDKSQMLLLFIEKSLEKCSKTLDDITEIEVMTGPGSFTGLRVGVSVAQALGWSLSVPVNGNNFIQKKYVDIEY